ncbi:MAG: hypothetical protein FWH50_02060, partial [Coriobacteriia bacterium]|nr:hypothetical protein [Coriobacteriia bacterium]
MKVTPAPAPALAPAPGTRLLFVQLLKSGNSIKQAQCYTWKASKNSEWEIGERSLMVFSTLIL